MPFREPWIMSLLVLLVACGKGEPDGPGTRPVEVASADVVESGPVVCADPAERVAGWFEPVRNDGTEVDDGAGQTGGALVIEDLDEDGFLDVIVPVDRTENGVVAFWGKAGGGFDRDEDTFAAVDGSVVAAASVADIDGDADLDLFLAGFEAPHQLLVNDGWRAFRLVDGRFAGATARRSQSASWGDADGDGDLDLFVGAYGAIAVIDVLEPTPDCSDHLPDRSELWINDGTGQFSDGSALLPDEVHDGLTFASSWLDVDDDGSLELFVANDDGLCVPSTLMRRGPDGTWSASTAEGFHPGSHDMGIGVGDLNEDGRPDFVLTSWNRITLLQSAQTATGVRWADATAARALTLSTSAPGTRAQPGDQVFGWGTEMGDLDNDGDLDLVAVFGYWDAYPGAGDPLTQRDAVFLQDDDGRFSDRAGELGLDDDGIARSVVLADLDGNGSLDMVKRILDRPNPMVVQRCSDRAWLTLDLRDPAGPNPFAVGAKVTVTADGRSHVRWVTAGGTGLYTGAPLRVHVGLADASTAGIRVRWPDGAESALEEITVRQHLTVTRRR